MDTFIGRQRELTLLDTLWQRPAAALLIVYGRRRVGKTSLLVHWLQQRGVRALYWVAEPSSTYDQLRAFSQALYTFANPDTPPPPAFTYATWEQALDQVAALARQTRLALLLDEFTYLLANDPALAGVFQNAWDHRLRHSQLLLVLCGSHLGMLERYALAYQAPLYGRATAQLRVEPLPFSATRAYFPGYDAAERVAIYALFGGIPAYWERLDPQRSIAENIRRELLTPNNLMQAEPRLLLYDFVREPGNYVAILRAIAHGRRTQQEIGRFTGLAQGHASRYLSVLQEAGFVERRVPVTAEPDSRLGRYHITDPYLRFYYRFLAARQTQLALGIDEPALAEVQRHLLDYIGAHTWEELGREWVLRAGAAGQLSFLADQVGSAWTKTAQVDVVGINRMEKTLILGECKWSPRPMGIEVLTDLAGKAASIVPAQGMWRVLFVGLARGGWQPEAIRWAQSAAAQNLSGPHWRATGWQLVDLAQLDADLAAWTP